MHQRTFLNTNNELSPSKVMAATGVIAGAIILSAALISAKFPVSTAGVVALAVTAAALATGLLYYLVIVPVARREAPAPVATQAPLSNVDPVTRALNRQGITSSLLEGMALAQRYSMPLSVALARIDRFQELPPGRANAALQLVAQTVTEVIRLPDRVGRYADEEFLVVLPQTPGAAAAKVGERIRAAIEAGTAEFDGGLALTVSVGVAEYRKDQDLEKLLSHAHLALDEARAGGNRVARHKGQEK